MMHPRGPSYLLVVGVTSPCVVGEGGGLMCLRSPPSPIHCFDGLGHTHPPPFPGFLSPSLCPPPFVPCPLQLLPSSMPLSQIRYFLESMLRNCEHTKRDVQVTRRLFYLEYLQVPSHHRASIPIAPPPLPFAVIATRHCRCVEMECARFCGRLGTGLCRGYGRWWLDVILLAHPLASLLPPPPHTL
jgi:hypothetical protein